VSIGLILSSRLGYLEKYSGSGGFLPAPNVVIGSQEAIPEQILQLQNTSDAFIYIAEQVVPTVVSIQSTRMVRSADLEKFHDREDLRDYFRFKIPKEYRQRGSGSGIIVSRDGFILTNVHVVDKAQKLRVTLHDDREYDADIVGLDPYTEVAVVKIDAEDLPVARLGDSDKTRVGEWVLAIGNPLELRSTVTAGIISAKNRQIDILRDQYSIENFIQTDAAINPGNSGGALVNLRGEVIGVNTAIATETGYNAGFGFAIPINLAQKIMSDLIRKGNVERGYLGIAMQNIDEKKAKALGLDRPRGVFISQVLKGQPADRAGVQSKDVILRIDGKDVKKSNQVQAIIAEKSPGDTISLTLLRDGASVDLRVRLGKRLDTTTNFTMKNDPKKFEHLGLEVETLTAEGAAERSYAGQTGVVVTAVEPWSPAYDAGIAEGDIITAIDDVATADKRTFFERIDALPKGSVSIITVSRNNEKIHLFVEIPG